MAKNDKNDFDDSRGIEAISLQMDMFMLGQKTLARFHEISWWGPDLTMVD